MEPLQSKRVYWVRVEDEEYSFTFTMSQRSSTRKLTDVLREVSRLELNIKTDPYLRTIALKSVLSFFEDNDKTKELRKDLVITKQFIRHFIL